MRYTDHDIVNKLLERIAISGVRGVARDVGVSATFVSMVSRQKCPPGPVLAEYLGFQEDGLRWVKQE